MLQQDQAGMMTTWMCAIEKEGVLGYVSHTYMYECEFPFSTASSTSLHFSGKYFTYLPL